MIYNRRAQIGKGIVFLPVLLFIIMIMAAYLFVVAGSLIKQPAPINPESVSLTDNDILLKKIDISINEKETEMLILDAYILYENKKIEKNMLYEKLKSLISDENRCLVISKKFGNDENKFEYLNNFYFEKYGDIILDASTFDYSSTEPDKNIKPINLLLNADTKKKYISYYYGRC